MLKASRCFALSALIFVSLGSLGVAGTEPLFYIYHGQPKALTLDSASIAVHVNPTVANSHAGAIPMTLATQGFSDADIVAQPVPGWMILNARNALSRSRASGLLAASAEDASSVHAVISTLLASGDPTIEFVSPVFRDDAGDPIILTPTVLIGFQKDFSDARQSQLRVAEPEGAEQQKVEFPQPQTQRWQLHSRDGFAALDRANTLAQTQGVAYAELDMIVTGHADLIPTDPLFAQSWGLNNTGQSGGQAGFDLDATSAWDITTGSSSVIVLILDTGVQQNHPDINQVTGKDFTSDAASNPNGGPFGTYDNHGTWVAGCVSGLINNGLGTAGIAPGVKVASARCYNNGQSNGSYTFQFSWVVDALSWGQSIGARITNNSNHYDQPSSEIENAYANTRANGMVHFASAGNDGTASISYPSSISSVNSVGAANRFGQRSNFSQYGTGLKYLAPGEQIYTTDRTGSAGGVAGDYALVDGTSFASPYVAGVAALVISQNPGLSAADVESQIQNSCRDMGPVGYDTGYGYGVVDAFRALAARITSNLNPSSVQIGDNFDYQITATNNPTSYSASGLPEGLQINQTTGLISGIPTIVGTFTVTVIAHTAFGDATATIQLIVLPLRITSNLFPSGVEVGTFFSYSIAASNNPTSFETTILPNGLQLNPATGLISGQPLVAGTFPVTVTAHGAVGDATAVIRIEVTPRQITSPLDLPVDIGGTFSYQIAADNQPVSFTVIGLPAGLVFDPASGQITGVPTLSGTYSVTVIAHGTFGDATSTLHLTVNALSSQLSGHPVTTFAAIYPSRLVIDPNRPRAYAVAPGGEGIYVIDTDSLTIIKTISSFLGYVGDACISLDGNTLFLANPNQSSIGRIDLNTLNPLSDIQLHTIHPQLIREAVGNRLEVMTQEGDLMQLDSTTGASRGVTMGTFFYPAMESSSDGKTLFVTDQSSILNRYDVSTNTPRQLEMILLGTQGRSLSLSHNEQFLCFVTDFPLDPLAGTTELSATNFATNYGSFRTSTRPSNVAFGIDDTVAYQISENQSKIEVFETGTCKLLRSIPLDGSVTKGRVAVENSNKYLFVYGSSTPLEVYSLAVNPPASTPPHTFRNVSTRTFVQTGDNVEIGGFIIHGNQPKKVVLRAIGPSLAAYQLPAVTDPVLELHNSTGAIIATNDNWNSHRQDVLNTGLAPSNEHESVIVTTLAPGNYTVILSGLNGATGTALFELFDVDPANSRISNISTRANVGTGDNVMIGGFIIDGGQSTKIIARAIGPSLTQFGISTALLDPTLELHDGSGNLVSQNDDWRSDQEQLITNSGLAPSNDHESAIIATLPPGNYTAIVRGKNSTTGIALVEVYNLESN
jgi:subtilisin family serine protease